MKNSNIMAQFLKGMAREFNRSDMSLRASQREHDGGETICWTYLQYLGDIPGLQRINEEKCSIPGNIWDISLLSHDFHILEEKAPIWTRQTKYFFL